MPAEPKPKRFLRRQPDGTFVAHYEVEGRMHVVYLSATDVEEAKRVAARLHQEELEGAERRKRGWLC